MKCIILSLLFIFCSSTAFAEDSQAVLSRMKSRMPEILELKNQGIIGETNDGFLELRVPNTDKQPIIKSENADRLFVYKIVAKKQNVSVDRVGRIRALKLAQMAGTGDWLEDDAGNWYQKNTNSSNKAKPIEMPDNIYIKIKNKCQNDWPDDFRMQKYCVEKQVESWQFLNQ
jgi:uncharacterized protein